MVFNSPTFLVFFITFFVLYWWFNNRFSVHLRNLFTLAASYIFYGWWDWRFLSLIVVSSLIDFFLGLSIAQTEKTQVRKRFLFISLSLNLGLLAFFKYYGFFVDSFVELLSTFSIEIQTSTLQIILPVGISFYTFQTMSYTIDIYRKRISPTRNALTFFTFVAFFPQLVAGPIERASHLLPQFQGKKKFSYPTAVAGMRLILWGFFKKMVIADNFGVLADAIFNAGDNLSGWSILAGTLFFAVQIYGDFSGYSDIAIGSSKLLGFDLMTNFLAPYFSKTFSEFWRRWHISLSTWFRDYIYIPLGGNRAPEGKIRRNILITFLLSGLWHGANWTFLIWGGLHGAMLILERSVYRPKYAKVYAPFAILVIILLWLPFRAVDVTHLLAYIKALFQFQQYSWLQMMDLVQIFPPRRILAIMVVGGLFFYSEYKMQQISFADWLAPKTKLQRWLVYYGVTVVLFLLGNFSVKPHFIYFQF